jgi:hypothetical protein
MTQAIKPDLIAHADWSTDPKKRWMCIADLRDNRSYKVESPERVGELSTFFHRLWSIADRKAIVVGFDFPIGLPSEYAKLAGITDFVQSLMTLGRGPWSEFYEIAENPSEISLHRPFYPYRPGGTSQRQLCEALGVRNIDSLRRICEQKTPSRGSAAPLFWTLGPQQVGRAAISGWKDLIAPALHDESITGLHMAVSWSICRPYQKTSNCGRRDISRRGLHSYWTDATRQRLEQTLTIRPYSCIR